MTSPTSYLNHLPIVSLSLNTIPVLFLVLGVAEFVLLNILLIRNIPGFLSRTRAFLQSQIGSLDDSESQEVKEQLDFESSNQNKKVEDGYLWREDAETVMSRLGIFCHPEGDKLRERLGSDDFSNMFEEKEPSLEEVKEAFDVFDENRDGFIDAGELQRVLCNLGFQEGSEMENCRSMIAAFDDSGDGRIDFSEFVKFMANTLSNCSFGKT